MSNVTLTCTLLRKKTQSQREGAGPAKTELDGTGKPKGDKVTKKKPQMNTKDHIFLKLQLKTLMSPTLHLQKLKSTGYIPGEVWVGGGGVSATYVFGRFMYVIHSGFGVHKEDKTPLLCVE